MVVAFDGLVLLSSAAVADGDLIAVAPNALAAAVNTIRVSVSDIATLHLDTAPSELVSAGNVATGGSVRGLWQTAGIGVKLVTDLSWGLRSPSAVAHLTGLAW